MFTYLLIGPRAKASVSATARDMRITDELDFIPGLKENSKNVTFSGINGLCCLMVQIAV